MLNKFYTQISAAVKSVDPTSELDVCRNKNDGKCVS